MRIIDAQLAIEHQQVIKAFIFNHQGQVTQRMAELPSLNLAQFGIVLDTEDFTLERAAKWTKKSLSEYRPEVIVMHGLWRAINVRLRNKARGLKARELLREEKEHAN